MKNIKRSSLSRAEHGYTLIEALVVVAIIGLFSLITIPNFLGMYRGSKLKTSLRNVTTDMRWARQRAVTRDRFELFSVDTANSKWAIYEATRSTDPMTPTLLVVEPTPLLGPKELDPTVTFTSTGDFKDDLDKNGSIDIVFGGDGTVFNMPTTPANAYIVMKSSFDIPKNTYKVSFSSAGRVSATSN